MVMEYLESTEVLLIPWVGAEYNGTHYVWKSSGTAVDPDMYHDGINAPQFDTKYALYIDNLSPKGSSPASTYAALTTTYKTQPGQNAICEQFP